MSPTPRRTIRPGPVHLAGVAVVVLLAACGDGGYGGDSSGAGGRAGSAAAETSAAGGADEFCTRAAQLDQRVESALSDLEGEDPSVKEAFQQLADELRAMDPPDAIASDWDALAGGVDQLATAFAEFDITDPDSLAALEEAEDKLTTASDNVETYLRDECGISP
jgi:hypothetical protein